MEDSGVEDSAVEDSAVADSTVEDSAVEDSVVEDSVVEDSAVEDSAVEDSTVEDSVLEQAWQDMFVHHAIAEPDLTDLLFLVYAAVYVHKLPGNCATYGFEKLFQASFFKNTLPELILIGFQKLLYVWHQCIDICLNCLQSGIYSVGHII